MNIMIFSFGRGIGDCNKVVYYILNISKCVCCWGALRDVLRLSLSIVRVFAGLIILLFYNLEIIV